MLEGALLYKIRPIIDQALREDIGRGDITTEALVPSDAWGTAILKAKDEGIFCGEAICYGVFDVLCPQVQVKVLVRDGEQIAKGDVLAQLQGPAWAILMGERVLLNFIQHLSGISTKTARLKALIADYPCTLVETRKTLPGLRLLQKYAVRVGGGGNHRLGLDDAVMIKDNHIVAVGSITEAVRLARSRVPFTAKIEVETKEPEQVREALDAGADIIMLDNMSPALMEEMVKLIDGRALVEASGSVNEENIVKVAQCGVDIISVGALTHSVKALDISLDLKIANGH